MDWKIDWDEILYGDLDKSKCRHWDCPYKYCPHHQNYDEDLEVICADRIPDPEWGDTMESCISYLDL